MSDSSHFFKLTIVGVSTGARLLGTLLLFGMLARAVGPEYFGVFSYWYVFGVIVGSITDYGFAQQLLKNVAASDLGDAVNEVKRLEKAKVLLASLCFLITLIIVACTVNSPTEFIVGGALVISGLVGSFYEFYATVLRACKKYTLESKLSLINSLGGTLLTGVIGYQTGNIVVAATVLVLVRFISVLVAYNAVYFRVFLYIHFSVNESAFSVLRNGFYYAVDNVASQMFGNADSLSAKHLLDASGVGIYISGTRFVQAALSGLPIVASVFLPSIVKGDGRSKNTNSVMHLFTAGVGFFVFISFWALNDLAPIYVFGPAFSSMSRLMPWFGIFVMFRYLAAAPGINLTARGKQKQRSIVTLISVAAILIALALIKLLTNVITEVDLCKAMVCGAVTQYAGYLLWLIKCNRA